jgi:hypothetical protein
MKYLLVFCLLFSPIFADQVLVKEKLVSGFTAYKLLFDGHTYIYFTRHINNSGNAYFHDPECERCQNKLLINKETK